MPDDGVQRISFDNGNERISNGDNKDMLHKISVGIFGCTYAHKQGGLIL